MVWIEVKRKTEWFYHVIITIIVNNLTSNHSQLVAVLKSQYDSVTFTRSVTFVSLTMRSPGFFTNPRISFLEMCGPLSINKHHTHFLISKLSTVSTLSTNVEKH